MSSAACTLPPTGMRMGWTARFGASAAGAWPRSADGHRLRNLAQRQRDHHLRAPAGLHQHFRLAHGKPLGPRFDGIPSHRNAGERELAVDTSVGDFFVLAIQVLDANLTAWDVHL